MLVDRDLAGAGNEIRNARAGRAGDDDGPFLKEGPRVDRLHEIGLPLDRRAHDLRRGPWRISPVFRRFFRAQGDEEHVGIVDAG